MIILILVCIGISFIFFIAFRLRPTLSRSTDPEPAEADCPLCRNLSRSYGDSTSADLVITGVFGHEEKVQQFIRTLRSVGSKASIIMVTNETVPPHLADLYSKCNAHFYQMITSAETDHFYPHSLRYLGYRQFFEQAKQTYNRIFHSDSYDVFFQSDPFTKQIEISKLYFVLEKPTIADSEWNTGWLGRAYNSSVAAELGNFTVSCSGTVIGGAKQFKLYLDTMLGHPPFWANGRHSLDQAYHNYLLHTGEFRRNGVKEEFLDCDSQILTMHYCSRGKSDTKSGKVVTPNKKRVPAVVHQYNMFQGASRVLSKVCPAV
jgi:hypothetical protein